MTRKEIFRRIVPYAMMIVNNFGPDNRVAFVRADEDENTVTVFLTDDSYKNFDKVFSEIYATTYSLPNIPFDSVEIGRVGQLVFHIRPEEDEEESSDEEEEKKNDDYEDDDDDGGWSFF